MNFFGKFIETRPNFYKLDPCNYFSSSGLSWDMMLKMTGVKLEKISAINRYLFIERDLEEEFLTLIKGTVKQIKNTSKIMIRRGSENTLIKLMCMTGQ